VRRVERDWVDSATRWDAERPEDVGWMFSFSCSIATIDTTGITGGMAVVDMPGDVDRDEQEERKTMRA
jgi:hypothetical protein